MILPLLEIPQQIEARFIELPSGLQAHTLRVNEIAQVLAHLYGLDPKLVGLAALTHDIARAMRGKDLLRHATRLGLPINPVEAAMPLLLHGPVGSRLIAEEAGIEEPDVLEAVYWHTTFGVGLSPISKVVFLADKLDPAKASRYPFVDGELMGLARKDMDRAILLFIDQELNKYIGNGGLVHPASVDARNHILMAHKMSVS